MRTCVPTVWRSAEALTSPDVITRQQGLEALLEVGAQKVSPLVAYMVATCINDTDVQIRRKVATILADLITGEGTGRQALDDVRKVVTNFLHNMSEATAFSLLEVSVADRHSDKSIFHLFNLCPQAGKYLGEILTEWKSPLTIRQKAIYFVGLVGYLEALPILEKLYNRLESRQNGQYLMEFAPPSIKSDDSLLPYLRIAIEQLNAR